MAPIEVGGWAEIKKVLIPAEITTCTKRLRDVWESLGSVVTREVDRRQELVNYRYPLDPISLIYPPNLGFFVDDAMRLREEYVAAIAAIDRRGIDEWVTRFRRNLERIADDWRKEFLRWRPLILEEKKWSRKEGGPEVVASYLLFGGVNGEGEEFYVDPQGLAYPWQNCQLSLFSFPDRYGWVYPLSERLRLTGEKSALRINEEVGVFPLQEGDPCSKLFLTKSPDLGGCVSDLLRVIGNPESMTQGGYPLKQLEEILQRVKYLAALVPPTDTDATA